MTSDNYTKIFPNRKNKGFLILTIVRETKRLYTQVNTFGERLYMNKLFFSINVCTRKKMSEFVDNQYLESVCLTCEKKGVVNNG